MVPNKKCSGTGIALLQPQPKLLTSAKGPAAEVLQTLEAARRIALLLSLVQNL